MPAYYVGFCGDGGSTNACLVSAADELSAINNAGGPTIEGTVATVMVTGGTKPQASRYRYGKGQWNLESRAP